MASRIKIKKNIGVSSGQSDSSALAEFHTRFHGDCNVWRPPTDLLETEDCYQISVEIAGLREDELSITYHHERLIISGTRGGILDANGAYHQMEINRGDFATELILHSPVDLDTTKAIYANGFLTVTLPKTERKRIPVIQK